MLLTRELLQTVADIAARAGRQILAVYQRPGLLEVSNKADDSPLTQADLRAHQVIVAALSSLSPSLPILSEESEQPGFSQRQHWQSYWLVDPLDGTKEFIERNGEFTVNIALVRQGRPVLGIVHVPVTGLTYAGISDGSFQCSWCVAAGQDWREIHARRLPPASLWHQSSLKVVASRRHGSQELQSVLATWHKKFGALELLNMGSSLKICLLAEGKADIYPRFAPTSEWDTAAAHAVLRGAGGDIIDVSLAQLLYNQKQSLLNPSFFAVADLATFREGKLHETELAGS